MSIALPALGIEPIERRATTAGSGQWVVESLPVPLPGRWQIRVDVLVSDFEKSTLDGEVEVGPAGAGAGRSGPPDAPATQAFRDVNAKMHREMDFPFSGDADVDFVRGMIPHHQAAIDMARIVLRHGRDAQTRKWAADVIREQEREIAEMRAWLAKRAPGGALPRGGQAPEKGK